MLVVTELEEPFLPLPDELLVNLKDSRPVVEALLDAQQQHQQRQRHGTSAAGDCSFSGPGLCMCAKLTPGC
jgi:protein transport protein SEC24